MKRVLQRFLALMMVLWTSSQLSVYSYDFQSDGICYSILSEENKTIEVSGGISYTGEIIIPSSVTYNGVDYTVTAIGMGTFSGDDVSRVSLPSTLESIGEGAFLNCSQLESLTIPANVKVIGYSNFGECPNLKKLIMLGTTPPKMQFIYTLTEQTTILYVPEGCKSVYERNGIWGNFEIVEGDGSKDYLFNIEQGGISYVVTPLDGSEVQVAISKGEPYQGEVTVPETLEYDGKTYTVNGVVSAAFFNAKDLTEIVLPSTITTISGSVISGCVSLRKIVMLGDNPPTLDYNSGFDSYKVTVYVPEGSYDLYKNRDQWDKCNLVEGDGIKTYTTFFSIGGIDYAVIDPFGGGTDVSVAAPADDASNIVIPTIVSYENKEYPVVAIRELAFFANKNIKSVVIPESIKEIGRQAFDYCTNIESVTVLAKEPPVCEMPECLFATEIYPKCNLYLPKEEKENYESTEPWKNFTNIDVVQLLLNKTELQMNIGGSAILTAEISPELPISDIVNWYSDNEEIATVDKNGKVTAIALGETKIIAECAGYKAECTVTVTERVVPAESIEIIASDELISAKTLKKGETLQLTAKTTPVDATDKITWSSDNGDVATVDETGLVTAKGVGKAEIKVMAGEKSATCEITVISPAESVTLDVEEVETINKGEKLNMTATIMPEDCTDEVEWSVEGDAVTIVVSEDKKSCEVTAVKAGEATVTVKAGEKSASCKITVKVPMTGIELDKTEAEGYIGGTIQLTATVKPEDTTDDTTVTWTSSVESVATVDENGLVSCVAEGETVITATCGEFSAECTVTVTDRPPFVGITSLTLSETEVELPLNYTYSLFGIIAPENATNKELEWSTSNPDVARVYQGVVYGIVPGEAVITAKTTDGSNLSASCKFTIVSTSGIEGTEGDAVKVTAAAGVITVKGATVGATVEVYSMNGACVAVKTVESSVEELAVATSGIYVVRVGGKTFKVAL